MHTEEEGITQGAGLGGLMAEARDLVETYQKPAVVEVTEPGTGVKALAISNQHGIAPLPASLFDESRDAPRRRTGKATLLDLTSFIALTNRFSDPDSLIFANNNRSAPSLTTVFDYHRNGHTGDPRFGQHRAHFAFPLSDQWKSWHANNGANNAMDMQKFSAFLEDHIIDVLAPEEIQLNEEQARYVDRLGGMDRIGTPAKLMEVSRGLRVTENVETVNAVNLATGEVQMAFANEHKQSEGSVTVPGLFAIAIPAFVNGEPYQILARLRYRTGGGKVMFFYDLWRTDKVFDHAFNEAVVRVEGETGLPVLLGSPEA